MSLLDKLVVTTIPLVPKKLVRHFADPYIAGETLSDAIRTVRALNRQGASTTIDVLGEASLRAQDTQHAVDQYIKVVETINEENLDANISIKPTQFGLGLDFDLCLDNFRKVIEALKKYDNFVRIDMEDSPYTTLTYDLYETLKSEYEHVGVVMQAYMRRSLKDLNERVIPVEGAHIRLCKGIYIEPHEIAYRDFDIVRKNFSSLLKKAFKDNVYVGIATHDEMLIWDACKVIEEMEISKDRYEFQMLLGVTPHLRRQLISDGHKMRVYVPFGKDWYAYSTRRLKENPKMAGYVFKEILNFQK